MAIIGNGQIGRAPRPAAAARPTPLEQPQDSFQGSPTSLLRRLDSEDQKQFVAQGLIESWIDSFPSALKKSGVDAKGLKAQIQSDLQTLLGRIGPDMDARQKGALALAVGAELGLGQAPIDVKSPKAKEAGAWLESLGSQLNQAVNDPGAQKKWAEIAPQLRERAADPGLADLHERMAKDIGYKHLPTAQVLVGEAFAGAALQKLQSQDKVLQTYMPNDPLPPGAPPLKGWERVKGWISTDGNASSPIHKATVAALGATAGGLLVKSGLIIAGLTGGLGAGIALAVGAGAARYGYKAADALSGIGHWKMDEYPGGPTGREFNRHHLNPEGVAKWGFAKASFPAAKMVLPVLGGLAVGVSLLPAVAGPVAAGVVAAGVAAAVGGALGLASGVVMTVRNHGWAHMENPPKIAGWAMKHGITLDLDDHRRHHADADPNHGYAVVNGSSNKLLDEKWNVFRKAEKVIYQATGAVAECWSDPKIRAEAMAQKIPGEKWLVKGMRAVANLKGSEE